MTNKSVAASCRTLSLKERIFVQELVDSVNEKVSYMAWVRKRKIKNEKLLRVEDRILVITQYRILTIGKRRGGVNKKICRNGHFFDLKKIHRFSINHMIVEFKTFVIDCFTDQSDDFISSIFKNYYPLVEGFPKDHKLIFEGNDEKVSQFQTQPNSIGKGFLKTYQGWCNYYQLQENQKIMDRIENDIIRSEDVEKQTVLDLSFLSEVLEISKDSKILLPISMALRFNKHFKEIYLSKVKIRTILSNFSQPIAHSNIIQKITFSKLKISEGFNSLGEAFCNQQLPLTFLDLSSNKMSDSNMKMFANGIEKLNSGLTYLDLSSNHLNPNSISILINALTKNKKHHNITHLNLSRNKFGNKGSLNFKNYLKTLKSNNKLNYLNLSNCKISLSLIVNSIIENKQTNCLKYLYQTSAAPGTYCLCCWATDHFIALAVDDDRMGWKVLQSRRGRCSGTMGGLRWMTEGFTNGDAVALYDNSIMLLTKRRDWNYIVHISMGSYIMILNAAIHPENTGGLKVIRSTKIFSILIFHRLTAIRSDLSALWKMDLLSDFYAGGEINKFRGITQAPFLSGCLLTITISKLKENVMRMMSETIYPRSLLLLSR
ncbi:leucine-rich repeat [Anaeramoeba flamelloides]|uniref:Leucine-rich repeat n=1 Tax=Anaeramoeba flamelloides TaxID=1746091 RepID=A0ABQ8XR26_9EUKA|nr:leucine-rich repeat [Anaeramoeba flamelloides]